MNSVRVVAALLERDGRLFAARRAAGRREAGLWELPGGKVEPGEDDRTALARELREELNIEVSVEELVTESSHTYPHSTINLVGYRCRLVRGEPVLRDHDASVWLEAGAVSTVAWAPADLPLLEAWSRSG